MAQRVYSLRKSRGILTWVYDWYKKKGATLSAAELASLESDMAALDADLLAKKRAAASQTAQRLETFATARCKKGVFEYIWELALALVFALIIATLVRQMWFELYEIPTGSMRPTFKEQDHLTVTKTAFGINFPLETRHLYFDPALVQRTSVLIFSADNLPLAETDTTYFGIFPYKKRYIKRLVGKPGDALYFYGGQLYGVDKDGHELAELRARPWMEKLEYVPFLSFEGDVTSSQRQGVIFNQMHRPVGRLATSGSSLQGEVFTGKEWVKDEPLAQLKAHAGIETYSDILGMRNYAEARLLTKAQAQALGESVPEGTDDAVLYLQMHHTPSLNFPQVLMQRAGGGLAVAISGYSTLIPLQQRHLDALMDNLYTARFVVADGKARRYAVDDGRFNAYSPSMAGVPDGTYEFYFGKGAQIRWGGIETAVPGDSPLYARTAENVQKLFNLGMEMSTVYAPSAKNPTLFPHRYAYFRHGDLYVMGAPLFKKDDPVLTSFLEREHTRQQAATAKVPYVAFRDYGPPLKEGKIDASFIKTFGVVVPENHYLVLGDNHAMSADSRVFGFVPQDNLQGAPCWILWPPGDRLGAPPQLPYPFMNVPRAIIWSIAGVLLALWYAYHRWSLRQPVFKKKSF